MVIEKLTGTDVRLYQLVAPLVMKASVLRQNNNYPFKTSVHHVWFVALDNEVVVGFIPVEQKGENAVINNYYIYEEQHSVLALMLQEVIRDLSGEFKLQAVTHTRHIPVFQECGFFTTRTWKLYVKMEYRKS